MKKILVMAAMVAVTLVGTANAGLIVNYDFTNASGNEASWAATSSSSLVNGTALVRGPGLVASAAGNSFSSSSWTTSSIDPLQDYYEFTIMSNADTLMDLSTLSFAERRSGTGIRDFQLRTSLDGFLTFTVQETIGVPDDTATRNQAITLSGLTGLTGGTTVGFRLYGYNSEASTGTWRIANHSTDGGLYLDGNISAIPEPSALLLVGSILGFGALRRRRS